MVALAPDDTIRLFPVNQYPPLRGTQFTVGELDYIYTTGFQPDPQRFTPITYPAHLQTTSAELIRGSRLRSRRKEPSRLRVLSQMVQS